MNTTDPTIDRLRTSAAALRTLQGPIEAGRPWPQRGVEHDAPESEWGPLEVLAHLVRIAHSNDRLLSYQGGIQISQTLATFPS